MSHKIVCEKSLVVCLFSSRYRWGWVHATQILVELCLVHIALHHVRYMGYTSATEWNIGWSDRDNHMWSNGNMAAFTKLHLLTNTWTNFTLWWASTPVIVSRSRVQHFTRDQIKKWRCYLSHFIAHIKAISFMWLCTLDVGMDCSLIVDLCRHTHT